MDSKPSTTSNSASPLEGGFLLHYAEEVADETQVNTKTEDLIHDNETLIEGGDNVQIIRPTSDDKDNQIAKTPELTSESPREANGYPEEFSSPATADYGPLSPSLHGSEESHVSEGMTTPPSQYSAEDQQEHHHHADGATGGLYIDHGTTQTSHSNQDFTQANGSGTSTRAPPTPIAICGMALRLPGGVRTPEAFWDVLYNGKDLRGPIPESRFNIDAFDDKLGKKSSIKTHYGYFLEEDLACLDTSFFSMSKQEVEKTDPQQRQMLEVARECLESAGEVDYRGKLIGCYVGTFGEDWLMMQSKENQFTGGYNFSGDLMIANRLSYEYDFKGPR